jgi:hypothetical protein
MSGELRGSQVLEAKPPHEIRLKHDVETLSRIGHPAGEAPSHCARVGHLPPTRDSPTHSESRKRRLLPGRCIAR